MPTTIETRLKLKDLLLPGGLIVALAGNGLQFWYNLHLQRMSTRVENVAEFRESGSELDRAVIDSFDALAVNGLTVEPREEFKEAFIEHVLKTEAKREFLGASETDEYLEALNVLNSEVSNARNATGAGSRVEALSEVVRLRREISEDTLSL